MPAEPIEQAITELGLAAAGAGGELSIEAGLGGAMPWDLPLGRALEGRAEFVDHGGPVMEHVAVQLIFWGTAWSGTGLTIPTRSQVTDAIRKILDSPYLSRLHQYRDSIGYLRPDENGVVQGTFTGDRDVGSSPADPPPSFEVGDVARFVENLIMVEAVPIPNDDLLYAVIMPPGFGGSADGKWWYAAHFARNRLRVAWIGNDGYLDTVTTLFSHELVEAITDPEGTAIKGVRGTCGNRDGWCEIGDICEDGPAARTSAGVAVQKYWSAEDGKCIAPTTYPPSPLHPYFPP